MNISRDESYVLKAFAILSVIAAHANGWAHAFTSFPILGNGRIMTFICNGGMALFLFLSGYGLYKSFDKNGLSGYWDKKLSKVFVPAILVQLLWFMVEEFTSKGPIPGFSEPQESLFAEIICLNQSNKIDGTMWYLSFIFYCYLVFSLIFGNIRNIRLAVIVHTIWWVITMRLCLLIWEDCHSYMAAFAAGVIVSSSESVIADIVMSRKRYVVIALLLLLLAGGLKLFCEKVLLFDNLASIFLAFAVICATRSIGAEKLNLMRWLGKHSFSLYLLEAKTIFGLVEYDALSQGLRLIVFAVLFAITILLTGVLDSIIHRTDKAYAS